MNDNQNEKEREPCVCGGGGERMVQGKEIKKSY